MTGNALIARALKLLGVLGASETADSDDALDALDTLNDMVSGWKLDPGWMHAMTRVTKALTAGTASYTIGSGGSINVERPVDIISALLILDNTATTPTEVPLDVLTDQRWQGIPQKTMSGQPGAVFLDRAWTAGLATLNIWPVTSQSNQTLVLYVPGLPVASFADLTTDYTFPPGYGRALRYNLAKELAGEYGKAMLPSDLEIAATSLADVHRANALDVELVVDLALQGRRDFDIMQGGY